MPRQNTNITRITFESLFTIKHTLKIKDDRSSYKPTDILVNVEQYKGRMWLEKQMEYITQQTEKFNPNRRWRTLSWQENSPKSPCSRSVTIAPGATPARQEKTDRGHHTQPNKKMNLSSWWSRTGHQWPARLMQATTRSKDDDECDWGARVSQKPMKECKYGFKK
jgi:hypothetical protein